MSDNEQYALASIFGPGLDEMISHTPHAKYLGLRVVETGPRYAVLMLPHRPELIGDPARGVVFGGAITTLLDHASGLAVACAMDTLRAIATIDLRIDYLRAAEPGLDLFGSAECYKRTRSVAFVRGKAWDRDPEDPFAHAIATFMLGSTPGEHPLQRVVEGRPA
jgi:uncharacterized protein (TIGR00369 family)